MEQALVPSGTQGDEQERVTDPLSTSGDAMSVCMCRRSPDANEETSFGRPLMSHSLEDWTCWTCRPRNPQSIQRHQSLVCVAVDH